MVSVNHAKSQLKIIWAAMGFFGSGGIAYFMHYKGSMPNISQMKLVPIDEIKGTRNDAHSPNMSSIGVEEDSQNIFGLI